MTLAVEPPDAPEGLRAGLVSLREALDHPVRAELTLSLVPAPRKMAPFSVAVLAEVAGPDETDIASGRFVVLHDPAGQSGWDGDTRVIAFVEAQVEAEMAADPMLAGAGWSWLLEALEGRGAVHTATGGTVTRTVSRRFGQLQEPESSEVEVRASWTALPGPDGPALGPHLLAWCDLLCATAGLPPPGTSALRGV